MRFFFDYRYEEKQDSFVERIFGKGFFKVMKEIEKVVYFFFFVVVRFEWVFGTVLVIILIGEERS